MPAVTFDWGVSAGSALPLGKRPDPPAGDGAIYYANDWSMATAADSAGNVYMTGIYASGTGAYAGAVDFDPGPGVVGLDSGGATDIFLAKYSSAGALLWAQDIAQAGWVSGWGYRSSLAVDQNDNVYLACPLVSGGLVEKFDPSGQSLWSSVVGGTPVGIGLDPSGNVYLTGAGTGPFGSITLSSKTNFFVSKQDTNGNFLWARGVEYNPLGRSWAIDIAVDGSGNSYITGSYDGTVDFDPGPGTYNQTSMQRRGGYTTQNVFILKLNTSGNFVWAGSMGSASTYGDRSYSVAVDGAGNVFIAGGFADNDFSSAGSNNDFDPGKGKYKLDPSKGNGFLVKLDTNRNFRWAVNTAGPSHDLTTDAAGNVYATRPVTGVGISRFSGAGALVWQANWNGIGPAGIAVAGSWNVYVTGGFSGTADFNPGAGTSNQSTAGGLDASGNPQGDIFLLKLNQTSPLLAAGPSSDPGGMPVLTSAALAPLVQEAVARWQAAALSATQLEMLRSADIRIADLGETKLGLASGTTVWLDDNAAGWGWFVDPTPFDDSEFTTPGDQGERNHMDLLTVVMHEMGHVLGLDHDDGGLMKESLQPGERRLPAEHETPTARPSIANSSATHEDAGPLVETPTTATKKVRPSTRGLRPRWSARLARLGRGYRPARQHGR